MRMTPVKRFRGGLVFKAHRLLHHSTLGLRVIKKKRKYLHEDDAGGVVPDVLDVLPILRERVLHTKATVFTTVLTPYDCFTLYDCLTPDDCLTREGDQMFSMYSPFCESESCPR